MNYEKDIKIDPDALDIDSAEQPELMMQYGRHEAEMEKQFESKKQKLDITRAELDSQIRKEPGKFGVEKITESVVSNTIIQQEEYKDAYDKYLEAKFEYSMAKNALRAFSSRDNMLANLAKLHGQQYFAGPSVPRDFVESWNKRQLKKQKEKEQEQQVSEGVTRKMKRRK